MDSHRERGEGEREAKAKKVTITTSKLSGDGMVTIGSLLGSPSFTDFTTISIPTTEGEHLIM